MYCRRCRYSLAGLPDGACPECGMPFIAADPSTWAATGRPERRIRSLERAGVALAALQPLPMLYIYAEFVVARLILGRWPVPSLDDPKAVPGLGPMHEIGCLVIVGGSAAMLCWPVALAAAAGLRAWGSAARIAACGVIGLALAVTLGKLDPGNAGVWWFD